MKNSAWMFGALSGFLTSFAITDGEPLYAVMGVLTLTVTLLTAMNIFHFGGEG